MLFLEICGPICFKLGMMLDMTNLYSLIPVWMTSVFTQGHGVMGNLGLVQSFCCKVAWSNLNVHYGWLCKGDDCEEALHGKYGSIEHLLFLFCVDAQKINTVVSALAPTSSKLTSQMLVISHMDNHYRKINKAKRMYIKRICVCVGEGGGGEIG